MQYKIAKVSLILYTLFCLNYAEAQSERECVISNSIKTSLKDIPGIRFFDGGFYGGDLSVTDIKGKSCKLSGFGNKSLIVILWASWCIPCRHEIPQLATIQQNNKFAILAVNIDDGSNKKIIDFMRSVKAENLPVYRDNEGKLFAQLRQNSLIFGLPTALLFNKEHCLVGTISGMFDWKSSKARNLIHTLETL